MHLWTPLGLLIQCYLVADRTRAAFQAKQGSGCSFRAISWSSPLFFASFLYERGFEVEAFARSQAQLSQTFGVINTLLLLTSSWFVALAVRGTRASPGRSPTSLIFAAMVCGGLFVVNKAFEWGGKITEDASMLTDSFFMYYFILSGIHLAHVLAGLALLGFVAHATRRAETMTDAQGRLLEIGATFWHVVDLLWIVLFALLYLVH